MAGRQFTFFLAPSDQGAFEEALRSSGEISFLKDRSRVPSEELSTSVVREYGKEPLVILIARTVDVPNLVFKPIGDTGDFSLDLFLQPAVEFSRCYVTERFIRAGRLYRIDKYWGDDGKLVSKSPEFIEWGERLYKLAKGSLTRIEQGCFAGAEALRLRQAGLPFEGLDIAEGSIKA